MNVSKRELSLTRTHRARAVGFVRDSVPKHVVGAYVFSRVASSSPAAARLRPALRARLYDLNDDLGGGVAAVHGNARGAAFHLRPVFLLRLRLHGRQRPAQQARDPTLPRGLVGRLVAGGREPGALDAVNEGPEAEADAGAPSRLRLGRTGRAFDGRLARSEQPPQPSRR